MNSNGFYSCLIKSFDEPRTDDTIIENNNGLLIDFEMVGAAMNGEQLPSFDDLAKATISELANLITAQAVTKLHELGFKFDLTPPTLFAGEKMEIAALPGSAQNVEALIVPLISECGEIELNVAIRERAE